MEKSKEEIQESMVCPPGYTPINGKCVKDITPPAPNDVQEDDEG